MGLLSILLTFFTDFLLWLANLSDERCREAPAKRGLTAFVYLLLGALLLVAQGVAIGALLIGIAYDRYVDVEVMSAMCRLQGLDPEMVAHLM